MLQWQIGDVTVSRVFELEALMSPRFMFQHTKAEVLAIDWMRPHFVTEEGLIKLSIHALVVDSMGNVSQIRVLKGLTMGLTDSAVETVQAWKWKPATRDGSAPENFTWASRIFSSYRFFRKSRPL